MDATAWPPSSTTNSNRVLRPLTAAPLGPRVGCGPGPSDTARVRIQLGTDILKVDALVAGAKFHGNLSEGPRLRALRDRILTDFPAIAGLGPVSTALIRPFEGTPTDAYTVDGRQPTKEAPARQFRLEECLDNCFDVLGVPLVQGRGFTAHDGRAAPLVAVVSDSLAHQAWPGENPIGHRLRFVGDSAERFWTVVGVAADDRYTALDSVPIPTVYFPARQAVWYDPWFVVRTRADPSVALALVNHAIAGIDPMFAVRISETGPDVVRRRVAQPEALTDVFAALAVTALLLAALGLFGVLSAYVREPRRELAIRGALGATPMQLRSLVVMQTLVVAVAGIVCGAPLALTGPHVVHKVVTDVGPVTWLTVALVASLLLLAVAIATYGPTTRAARVDARTALSVE